MGIFAPSRLYQNPNNIAYQEATSLHAFNIAFAYSNQLVLDVASCSKTRNPEQCVQIKKNQIKQAISDEAYVPLMAYELSVAFWTDGILEHDLYKEFVDFGVALTNQTAKKRKEVEEKILSLPSATGDFLTTWQELFKTMPLPKKSGHALRNHASQLLTI